MSCKIKAIKAWQVDLPLREGRYNWSGGNFVEVFCDTPLDICEKRDVKGLYARARHGEIKNFTGLDDPYEPPVTPELTIQTTGRTPEECSSEVIGWLDQMPTAVAEAGRVPQLHQNF